MSGFKKFLLRGNLVELAVAFVIGAAFADPGHGTCQGLRHARSSASSAGKGAFGGRTFTIHNSVFAYGDFINALLAFIIVAAVLYFFVVMPFNALLDRFKKEPEPDAPTRDCPECLSSIPAAATRCSFCTAESRRRSPPDRAGRPGRPVVPAQSPW